jgi:hypothetical protein
MRATWSSSLLPLCAWLAFVQGLQLSGEVLPPRIPVPPPAYMVDNTMNYFNAAPDHGTLNGPVLQPPPEPTNSTAAHLTNLEQADRRDAGTSYWLANMAHGAVGQQQNSSEFVLDLI